VTIYFATDTPTSEQERREAKIVSRHLPLGYLADLDVVSDAHGNAAASAPDLMPSGQESSLKLLGGDIHRDLYKINAKAKLHQRAATFFSFEPLRIFSFEPLRIWGCHSGLEW